MINLSFFHFIDPFILFHYWTFFNQEKPALTLSRRADRVPLFLLDTGKLKKEEELVNNRRLLNSPPAPSLEREGEKPFTP
jgi:hypothetical protein